MTSPFLKEPSMSTLTTRLLPALAAASVLVLAGCSAGPSEAAAPTTSAAPQQQGADDAQRPGPGGGASGEIASVNGTVMQVRSTDAQTAVTWTDTTTFSATVAGSLADVTVGACVVAVSTATSGDATDTSAPLEAASVQLTEPADDGTCTGGFGGFGGGGPGGGGRPDGMPTDMPSMPAGELPDGAPTDLPSGGPGGFAGFGGLATGKVTATDGSTLTVEATGLDDATTTRTVTVTDATTYTTTVAADASAIVVGQCATARGESDDSGKVTATSVTVSAPTDGECSTGMLGRGFPGAGAQGDGSDA